MNVYRFELKSLMKSIIGWIIAICALTFVYLSMYPMFRSQDFDVASLFARFPSNLQALFGMTGLDTNSFTGYLTFPLKLAEELSAIGGLVLGASSASRDSRQKCADFLFSKPISRAAVMRAKLLAVLSACLLLFLALSAFFMMAARISAPGEHFPLSSAMGSSAVLTLLFTLYAAAGLLLGVCLPSVKGVAAIGIFSMFFFHIISSIGKVVTKNPDHPIVRAFVPVTMFDRSLAAHGRLEWPYLLLWALETAALFSLCFVVLNRREIE